LPAATAGYGYRVKSFDPRKQRLLALFVWGPLGLLIFGAGGVLVVGDEWGLTDRSAVAGVITGVVAMTPLVVLMLARRMSSTELRAGRHAFAYRDEIISRWPQWTSVVIIAFSVALGIFVDTAFGAAFLFTVMTVLTIAVWLQALLRKGLFQDTSGRSLEVGEPG
jgi:hypothetical protein